MDLTTAWEVYGVTSVEVADAASDIDHERAVADVFAQLAEIEIIAIQHRLTACPERIYLVHPATSQPVPIDLADIQRREERCRAAADEELRVGAMTADHYEEIDDVEMSENATERCPLFRRCPSKNAVVVTLCAAQLFVFALAAAVVITVVINAATVSPQPSVFNDWCILLIGGENGGGNRSLLEYYNPVDGSKCDIGEIGEVSQYLFVDTTVTSGCFLSDTNQIVIRESLTPSKPPVLYNLTDGTAKEMPLPYTNSSGGQEYTWGSTAAMIGHSRCLSCGGWNGGDVYLNECYQFDPTVNESNWTPVAPLPKRLGYAASATIGGTYYIIGGWNGALLDETHSYIAQQNRWALLPPISTGRQSHAATALTSTEFMVCGGSKWRSDCLIYNTLQGSWYLAANLTEGRHRFAMVTFNGNIYAIGGQGANNTKLNSVEKYDRVFDKWTNVKGMRFSRRNFVAVVV